MVNFGFDGWVKTPLELFDQQHWSECLHATIQAFNVINEPTLTQQAIEDTGLLHELSHLALGVEIWTHETISGLRQRLIKIQERVGR